MAALGRYVCNIISYDSCVRFSDHCVNTVTETSEEEKEEVEVGWAAPPAGSGCVRLRAAVLRLG